MNPQTDPCDSFAPLISGALDNELTQQQRQALHLHLAHCEQCTRLYQELAEQRGAVKFGVAPPTDAAETTSTRFWNRFGWLLIVLGVLPLLAYGVYQFSQDPTLPLWVKITSGVTVLGLLILFANVLRERLHNAKNDPYKKVQL
ncbi:anti-sigma factor family protein [Pseudidiomarina insulisalsae]|uniref:Putative zinc-finger domain-containing protein n=1 Tax=Pseudidiomarina insulisalsae TaxID=575789 RepID=A0A432YH10_9GAMM|nr:zf-HC2 domain-containing protein [Pseudidiomarina insulisalsae]RUO60247.1 hypothetical protein CWI71_07495 [Pseudidiomarina insulisalsae]